MHVKYKACFNEIWKHMDSCRMRELGCIRTAQFAVKFSRGCQCRNILGRSVQRDGMVWICYKYAYTVFFFFNALYCKEIKIITQLIMFLILLLKVVHKIQLQLNLHIISGILVLARTQVVQTVC